MKRIDILQIIRSKAGFTLIEMLMVLFILFIILSVSIIAVPRYAEKREMENFLQQLSHDLHYAQVLALNDQIEYRLMVSTASDNYSITQYTKRILIRDIPEGIIFARGSSSMNSTITARVNGSLSSAGTWRFRTKHYTYEFKVLIGEGRHYYHEQ